MLAQTLSHPMSVANALVFAALIHQLRREMPAAQELAEAGIVLATEQGLPFFLAWGMVLRGWALAANEQGEEGIAQMRRGLAAYRTTGWEEAQSYFLALLAEVCERVGQSEEGLNVLGEALAHVDKTGERFYEAELYRLYGELSLRNGETETGRTGDQKPLSDSPILRFPVSSPEDAFLKAIDIARKQQAKSLELRAVMSLARLWQQQSRKDEARQMLAEIYGWFTEGFDTKDLQEAKALLEELNH